MTLAIPYANAENVSEQLAANMQAYALANNGDCWAWAFLEVRGGTPYFSAVESYYPLPPEYGGTIGPWSDPTVKMQAQALANSLRGLRLDYLTSNACRFVGTTGPIGTPVTYPPMQPPLPAPVYPPAPVVDGTGFAFDPKMLLALGVGAVVLILVMRR